MQFHILFLFLYSSQAIYVLIPDTQYYSGWHPLFWKSQTDWICGCQKDLDINFVSHLGDIVDDGNSDSMWRTAVDALKCFLHADFEYSFVPGNHDYSNGNLDKYLSYFLPFINNSYTTFMPGHPENNYQFVTIKGEKFLVINLSYNPDSTEISWAASILQQNNDTLAIITSHSILNDCTNYIESSFSTLAYSNCNVILSVNGHYGFCGGENRVSLNNSCGNETFFLVQDYQQRSQGGNGYLRYIDFIRKSNTLKICVYTYTTMYDTYELDDNSYFSFELGNETFGEGCPIERKCFTAEMKITAPLMIAYFYCFCFIIILAQNYSDI